MNGISSVTTQHEAVPSLKSSQDAANPLLAGAARAARAGQSLAEGQVSAARGQADAGTITTALQKLATTTAVAISADSRLNIVA
jgi:hypothetical protein